MFQRLFIITISILLLAMSSQAHEPLSQCGRILDLQQSLAPVENIEVLNDATTIEKWTDQSLAKPTQESIDIKNSVDNMIGQYCSSTGETININENDLAELTTDLELQIMNFREARVLKTFRTAHRRCARGCGYISWGIWGDKSHQRRRSCHNSGDAIDIHALRCRGRVFRAKSRRFDQYVSCMRRSFRTIYRSRNHHNHAHFELRNCRRIRGRL